jgi:transposase-like protein
MPYRRLTSEEHARRHQAINDGLTVLQAAERLQCSVKSLYCWADIRGLAFAFRKNGRRPEVEAARIRAHEQGLTIRQAARALNCTEGSLREWSRLRKRKFAKGFIPGKMPPGVAEVVQRMTDQQRLDYRLLRIKGKLSIRASITALRAPDLLALLPEAVQ